MKVCRFSRPDGSIGWGTLNASGIQDLSKADPTLPHSMHEIIENWRFLLPRVQGLVKRLGNSEESLQVLCPFERIGKILCIGLNYRDHALETNQPIPTEPIVFCKAPTALIGPDDDIVIPQVSTQVDFEAELVVVIGKRVRNVRESDAHQAIFGYTVGHDVSARDWQIGKPGKQFFLGKSFDTFAPLGPAIALADSISNPMDLRIQSRINGQSMQDSSTSQLIFSPAFLIAYISQVITLDVGDVIYTGTPSGVGIARKPQRFLQPGDTVEIEIEALGTLRNHCVAESVA
jgi:2-keto-4-pentenoate hydratase/2-oxohepta-3-ene-1,7-dioic acid hydratase in catechol pathway